MTKKTRRIQARRMLLTLSLVLVVAFAAVGGTIAWLTAETTNVINTFTTSTINVTIEETGTTTSGADETKSFQVIPGVNITNKDPMVSASASENVAYYVFVQITESDDWATSGLTYTVADAWTRLGNTNVYYKAMAAGTTLVDEHILKEDTIVVSGELTVEDLDEDYNPTLSFQAFAIQQAKDNKNVHTPAEAWALVSGNN